VCSSDLGGEEEKRNSLLDDYNDRKFFTTHSDGIGNRFIRDEFGRLQFSTPEMGLLSDGTGYATYDPYFDYGDPGYAAAFQPNEDFLVDGQTVTPMRGGGGNGQNNRDRIAAMKERSEIVDAMDRFNMLPGYEDPTLPGFLGFFESIIDNMDRDQQINNVMRDIEQSTSFSDDISGGSYTGSAGTDPSGGATPDTGPSGDDAALGKFGGSGYNNPSGNPFGGANIGGGTSGGAGTAGGHGAGQSGKGSSTGGDNPGNTGGTSRF
jgi:hypothetical protein